MDMRITRLAAASLALFGGGALAADLPPAGPAPIPAPAPLPNWSGPYVGGFIGGNLGAFSTRRGLVGASASGFGVVSGALAGYNWQAGPWVYGIEGDIGSSAAKAKFSARPGFPANEAESVYSLHARGRLGYDFGALMPFVAGGLAYGRLDQSQQKPLDFFGEARERAGWTIGAGVDAKVQLPVLGPSVLRAEYLYEGAPSSNFDLGGPVFSTRLSTHIARLALISNIGEGWRAPTLVDAADWSGAYFGLTGGGQSQTISTRGAGPSTSFTARGGEGGVYAGRNWMFGAAMLGVEGATMLANISGSGAQPGVAATSARDYFSGDVRARAGYAFGRLLPFAAAGIALDNAEEFAPALGRSQGNVTFASGVVGAGVDYMASDRIALRAEYLYSHTLSASAVHLASETCCNQSRSGNTLRFGVAYFFH